MKTILFSRRIKTLIMLRLSLIVLLLMAIRLFDAYTEYKNRLRKVLMVHSRPWRKLYSYEKKALLAKAAEISIGKQTALTIQGEKFKPCKKN